MAWIFHPRALHCDFAFAFAWRRIHKIRQNFDAITGDNADLRKNDYLQMLHDRNETLYYRFLLDNIEELAPLVYTPTVGEACRQFGDRWRRPRGMYFCAEDQGHMGAMVYNWAQDDVQVIVVTDGSRILGLGDLGCNGMGIPIGKLALYVSAGGVAPHRTLPMMFDVGTNNQALLDSEFYLGMQHERLKGDAYFDALARYDKRIANCMRTAALPTWDFPEL